MNNIVYDYSYVAYKFQGNRPNTNIICNEKGKAVCHRISYRCMCESITNALNFGLFYYLQNKYSTQSITLRMLRSICGTICAVMQIKNDSSTIYNVMNCTNIDTQDQYIKRFINSTVNKTQNKKIEGAIDNIKNSALYYEAFKRLADSRLKNHQYHMFFTYLGEQANIILDELFECVNNMKFGDSHMNCSIGDAYDCDKFEIKDGAFYLNSEKDGIALTNMLSLTCGKVDRAGKLIEGVPVFIYEATIKNEKFLYSSSIALPGNIDSVGKSCSPIYFRYANTGKYEIFNTTGTLSVNEPQKNDN